MASNSLTQLLPSFSGSSLTYNREKNVYLTQGYTSAAGNTYFQAVRATPRIVVRYDIGVGYCRTFLNGIAIYAYNGRNPQLISEQSLSCVFFSEHDAKCRSIDMLKDYLRSSAKALGQHVSDNDLDSFSRNLIEEAQVKRLN